MRVTVEDFDRKKDYLKPVLSWLSFVNVPTAAKPVRAKLLNAAEHIHRYITLEIPREFVAQHAECPHEAAMSFVHRVAKPEAGRPRITIQRVKPPQGRDMTFERAAKWRHSSFLDMYEDIGELTETKVAGWAGYRSNYLDKDGHGEWRVFEVFFKLSNQIWVIAMDVDAKEANAAKNGEKAFGALLKSTAAWVGR